MKVSVAARRFRRRFFVQALEDRTAPAVLAVTSLADAGAGTLRDAITQLNLSADPSNTIDATGVTGTITLASALPAIAKTVDIVGPGVTKLTVSGNNAVRVFNINNGGGALPVSISDLAITAGKATGADGGGIFLGDDVLSLRNVSITGCSSTTQGGGIGVATDGTVLMDQCTLSGNTALVGGGIYFQYNGRFVIENSTISANSATGAEAVGGGGVYFFGIAKNGTSAIRNSTISGNSAVAGSTSGGGGVCLYQFSGTLDIENTTIVNNSVTGVDTGGGGLAAQQNFTTPGFINIRSSIIAQNTAPTTYIDLFVDANFTVISSNSAYDINPSGGGVANFSGTGDVIGGTLNLGALANNGGPVDTHALGAGSAAINAGFNAGPSGTDNRGPTYTRKVGASVDIGSFEFGSVPGVPTASLSNLRLTAAGGTTQTFTVLYGDDGTIDTTTIGNDDIRVTGPGGYSQLATKLSTNVISAGRVQATYSIPANSTGNATKWDGLDNGTYVFSVEAGKVTDTLANAVVADAVSEMEVSIALPAASAKAPNIQTAQLGTTTNTITVTYTHELPISSATVGAGDIRVTGPNSYNQVATFKSQAPGSDSTTITAVYEVPAAGGTWDATDLGQYSINLEPGAVTDADGIAIPSGKIGVFAVALAINIQVNAANDEDIDSDGKTSLREALIKANANVADAPDSITFSSLFNSATTIALGVGELPITDGVIITGKGPALLTITAAGGQRIFNINETTGVSTITMSGMTLTGGSTGGRGAAIRLQSTDENLNVTDMVFSNNIASDFGGAIGSEDGSGKLTVLTVDRCVFTNNASTVNWGGAIFLNATTTAGAVTHGNTIKITNSSFENNTGNGNSGAVGVRLLGATVPGSVIIENTLFANNTAATAFGGACGFFNTPSGNVTIRNSTFTGNKALDAANGQGGAIQTGNAYGGKITISNSTFAFNQSNNGGAVARTSGAATLELESVIFYNNTAVTKGGIDFNGGNISAKNSIIFSTTGSTTFADLGGNQFGAAADPLLLPLANNGGQSKTHLPGSGSPAREAGSNPAGLTTDQRGVGFPRVLGSKADIGAVESVDPIPIAQSGATNVLVGGATSYTFTVTYSDDTGIAVNGSPLNTGDITITGPGGFSVNPTFLGVDDSSDGTPRVATYTFTPPGGSWNTPDNGIYTVSVNANEVRDISSNFVKAGAIGTFLVGVPLNIVVNATNDEAVDTDGKTSLREAVLLANATSPSVDNISFDATVFATLKTISLVGLGEIAVSEAVNIQGPGSSKVKIDGGGATRLFSVSGPAGTSLNISGVALTGASANGDGGVVNSLNAAVVLTNVVADGNNASGNGGVVFLQQSSASVTITDSVLTNNSAGGKGGVAANPGNSNLNFLRCDISKNSAGQGGAFSFETGSIVVDSCLLSGNSAGTQGGAVRADNVIGKMQFINSTLSGNTAGVSGGAFDLSASGGVLQLINCTLTGNSSGGGTGQGGAIFDNTLTNPPFAISLVSTILVSNPGSEDVFTAIPISFANSAFGSIAGGGAQTDNGGNIPSSTAASLQLAALANNGGATQTHAIPQTSPAFNAGSNTFGAAFDQRGTGFNRTSSTGTDIGAFEFQVATPPPTVNTVLVNGGGAQRSMVTSLKVTFSEAVTFPSGINSAFELRRTGPGTPTGLVNVSAVQSGSDVTVTFAAGGAVGIDKAGSLLDGIYELTVVASKVTGAGGALNGGTNFVTPTPPTGTPANFIHRLFGDSDGDRDVDAPNFGAFRAAFGGANVAFDHDGDADVDSVDFSQFRIRFGSAI